MLGCVLALDDVLDHDAGRRGGGVGAQIGGAPAAVQAVRDVVRQADARDGPLAEAASVQDAQLRLHGFRIVDLRTASSDVKISWSRT